MSTSGPHLTAIADLPDNARGSGGGGGGGIAAYGGFATTPQGIISMRDSPPTSGGAPTTYVPLNVHPNPYHGGGGGGEDAIGGGGGGGVSMRVLEMGMQGADEQPMYPLPVQDMPRQQEELVRDRAVVANYIPDASPPPQLPGDGGDPRDYIRAFEESETRKWEQFQSESAERHRSDAMLDRVQRPLLYALLFLVLQLPVWNLLLYKHVMHVLPVCNAAGEINLFGMGCKAALFFVCLLIVDECVRIAANEP